MTVDGDELRDRLRRHRRPGGGQRQLPARRSRARRCYFALRALLPSDVPANAGTYAALSIEAPEGSVVNAQTPAAVVAGNVETSQAIADTVLAALAQAVDLPAAGPGHDEQPHHRRPRLDLLRDDRRRPGRERRRARARPACTSGCRTRSTRRSRRSSSSTRCASSATSCATAPAATASTAAATASSARCACSSRRRCNLLTDRRRHAPEGAQGGEPGACGENLLNDEELPPKAARELAEGDVVTVRTPGGGGYGAAG